MEWKDTNDGKGCWAVRNGLRLIVKETDDGQYWWAVFDGDYKVDGGVEAEEVVAIEAAESAAEL